MATGLIGLMKMLHEDWQCLRGRQQWVVREQSVIEEREGAPWYVEGKAAPRTRVVNGTHFPIARSAAHARSIVEEQLYDTYGSRLLNVVYLNTHPLRNGMTAEEELAKHS